MQVAYMQSFPSSLELIGGKPTHFVEKIARHYINSTIFPGENMPAEFDFNVCAECQPKIHTIRKDAENQFRPGLLISHIIKNPYIKHIAPVDNVKSLQKIEIMYIDGDRYVWIDGTLLTGLQVERLAINDGFDSSIGFFAFFHENFIGKVVHWTDLKY
jgi:hypothetical protein